MWGLEFPGIHRKEGKDTITIIHATLLFRPLRHTALLPKHTLTPLPPRHTAKLRNPGKVNSNKSRVSMYRETHGQKQARDSYGALDLPGLP